MQTTIIKTQADMNRLIAGLLAAFARMKWESFMQAELRLMEAAHGGYWLRQAGPSGAPWPALAASTIRRKGHATILLDKGPLRDSLTMPYGGGIRITVDQWPLARMHFGTDVPYSRYHNEGGGRLPQREHVGLTLPHFEAMIPRAVDHAFGQLA